MKKILVVLVVTACFGVNFASSQVQPILGPEPNEYYFRADNASQWLISFVATPGRGFVLDGRLGKWKQLQLWLEALLPATKSAYLSGLGGSLSVTLGRRAFGYVDFTLPFTNAGTAEISLKYQGLLDAQGNMIFIAIPIVTKGGPGDIIRLAAGRLDRPAGLGDYQLKAEFTFAFLGLRPILQSLTFGAATENAFNFIEAYLSIAKNSCCAIRIQSGISF